MVGGDAVNVIHVLPQGILICSGAQHWTHLAPPTTNTVQVLVTQEEVVRTNLTCYLHTLVLRSSDDKHLISAVT